MSNNQEEAGSEQQLVACDKMQEITYGMRLVAGIPRDLMECDDEFAKQDVVDRFRRFLTDAESTIKNSVNAARVIVSVTNYETSTRSIQEAEYENPGRNLSTSYVFVMMDVDMVIRIRKSCLEDQCNDPIELPLPCPELTPATITNSDNSFTDAVDCGDTYVLPDIDNVDSDGSTVPTPAQTPFVCTPCASPSGIAYVRSGLWSGQGTSYLTGDEGWQASNGIFDDVLPAYPQSIASLDYNAANPFDTLVSNNAFGNKNRFTDENGLQIYGNAYFIDHLFGIGWVNTYIGAFTNESYNSGIPTAEAYTHPTLGYNDFHVPGVKMAYHYLRMDGAPGFAYSPWVGLAGLGNNRVLTSTSRNDSQAGQMYGLEANRGRVLDASKGATVHTMIVFRLHYT